MILPVQREGKAGAVGIAVVLPSGKSLPSGVPVTGGDVTDFKSPAPPPLSLGRPV